MEIQEWKQYYQFVKLNPRRRAEMVARCGGIKTVVDPKTLKSRDETLEEAAARIEAEINALPDPKEQAIRDTVEKVLAEKEAASVPTVI